MAAHQNGNEIDQYVPPAQRAFTLSRHREHTRSKIALYYVVGYLGIIVLVLAICAFKGFAVTDYKDMLLAVSGILSGPLGFIIGYYFKSQND